MDVFDLFAKIKLDSSGYEKGLSVAKDLGSKVAGGITTAFKASTAAIAAAGTAVAGLTKQSLDAVANYEQLVGGVDKIFGNASKKVQEYANKAYETAGLSANEYMENVTSFSASLLQSLGGDTEKAADAANRAIIDMSDNVNTYGSSMDSVMNAYQGFSKQNYTMLDNLKLGYGGTKEEMERLIVDASQMTEEMKELGVTVDADSMSFGNIVNAISVVQKRLKIAGTTHDEAAKTVSGSIASMKAAWKNFLTGTGSPAQFTEVLSASIGNIKEKLGDIIPRLTEGLTVLVDNLAPEIPPIIEDVLPSVIKGATTLVTGLTNRLPELVKSIFPSLADGIISVTTSLVGVLPNLVTSLKETIPVIVTTIMSKKGDLLKAGKDIIKALLPEDFDKVPEIVTSATGFITSFLTKLTDPKNLKSLNDKAFELIGRLVDGLTSEETLEQLVNPENGVFKIVDNIGQGLVDFADHLLDGIGGMLDNFVKFLSNPENVDRISKGATDVVTHLGEALTSQESKDALGHFLVSFCQFVGSMIAAGGGGANAINWEEDVGGEIAKKIAKGMWENLTKWIGAPAAIGEKLADAVLGNILGEEYSLFLEEDEADLEKYNRSGTTLQYDEWKEKEQKRQEDANKYETYYDELSNPNVPDFVKEQMRKGHAKGFYANQKTYFTGVIGEAGDEVLLPLDNNTSWMDKLAEKLGSKMGGGDIYITVNAQSDKAEDIVSALDEAFRDRQIAQDRSTGGTGWK